MLCNSPVNSVSTKNLKSGDELIFDGSSTEDWGR